MSDSKILQLMKDSYFNRNGLLLLIVTGLASWVVYEAVNSSGARKEILLAVSTGLLSSALFAFLQILLTGLRYEALVAQSIEDRIESTTRKALEQVTAMQREFLPIASYPASNIPDRRFNLDLNLALRSSQRYMFRGVTGRYAMARLVCSSTVVDEVHIFVANPAHSASIDARVTHLLSYVDQSSSYQEVYDGLTAEIVEAIVGARHAAKKCRKLTIYLMNEVQSDRVEVLDGSMFLTLYSDLNDRDSVFPRTLRFEASSSIYRIYSNQLSRSRDWAAQQFQVRPNWTDSELAKFLSSIGRKEGLAEVKALETRFLAFAKQFEVDASDVRRGP